MPEEIPPSADPETAEAAEAAVKAAPTPSAAGPKPENPLANILVNVLIPVVVLNFLSKEHRLGPLWAMIIAVSLPLGYGIWFAVTRKKANFFSLLGLVSILLTGGLGLAQANATWFALKEALIPLMFGIAILGSHWTSKPLLNVFLLSPELFDLKRIDKAIADNNASPAYGKLRFNATLMLAGSMFASSVMNFFLALYFLKGKESDQVAYNEAIGKLTGVGFAVIGIPMLAVMVATLLLLLRKLRKLTGLEQDDIFLPR
jgi:hypothetical protein